MTRRYPMMAPVRFAGACALLCTTIAQAQEVPPVPVAKEVLAITKPDNWIHNESTGLRFRLPSGWYATSLLPAGDGAKSIVLVTPEPATGANAMLTCGPERQTAPLAERDAEAALREQARARETGRLARTPTYRNRADSFDFKVVNGQPALAWYADYDKDGVKWSEYVVRVMGNGSFGSLVVRAPADRIEALRASADAIVGTLQLP